MKKRTSVAMYILAAVIVLLLARHVQFQLSHDARQSREEMVMQHQLHIVTNEVYYADTNFVATVQLSDLQGQPLKADLDVSLHRNDRMVNEPVSFSTDYFGRSTIEFPLHNTESGYHNLLITVASEFGMEHFNRDIRIAHDSEQNFIIHFDKGLYNPGDDVLFRIMALASATAHPIAGEQFVISIFDGNDNRVFVEAAQASDFGIISGRFRLADEVNSGLYRLAVEHNGVVRTQSTFEVSPFVLPRFEVTLQTDKNEYLTGETIYLTGHAMYFFGEPVNQGVVNVYVNGTLQFTDIALDENGEFSFSYIADRTGRYDIWVEVIDNSNYRIEASTSVRASEGVFEIDVMPEHGYLVQAMPNTVYVFTHTANGDPVQTFLQISGRGFSRQVATDHNGIGVFILEDVTDVNHIQIRAVDTDNNSIQQDFVFDGVLRDITLSTNKPRYAMGETIYLSLNRRGQGDMFKIYAYRNDRLIQMVYTTQDSAELNLGDVFGLIDIYAVCVSATHGNPIESLPHARKTVFIDPGHYMQLTVRSDMPEYRPGAIVSLDIDVTDERGRGLEAALLVSIVDEAMLSLAANDLSIDNIRLALEDIRFGDDLDAATLYASLIAGASEQAITRLLLRPGDAVPFVQTATLVNFPQPIARGHVDMEAAVRTFLNTLRILAIIGVAIAFFIVATRKKNAAPASENTHEDSANTPVSATVHSKGSRSVIWVVIIALILFVFALFFLTSCSSDFGDDRVSNDMAASAPAPAASVAPTAPAMEAADDMPSPGAAPQMPVPETAHVQTPSPESAPQMSVAADSDMDTQPESVPDEPAAIETQTARVRRLFLETMLFVPELIAQDGHADLAFILADNITTWNIQVVGNTRDGLVGHTQSSIRAFQPFFVDFELPRNSIRYDQVSIPVTVFNYTEEEQTVILTIAQMDWFDLHIDPVQTLTVASNRSQMMYVPITITQFGDFAFRVYADTHGFADAAERGIRVNPEGFRIRQVVSSGSIESSTWQHLLFMHEDIPDTRSAFITFYPSVMSQVIEGMENIFRMPFGCFEQTSSILYPNILALRYMQQNNIDNPTLTQTALEYISSGYQRLLTFEVRGEKGGFSLFGDAPAETVLTAYGLMQLKDLTSVYTIDERVLDRMSEFLFNNQNNDGSFQITGHHMYWISDSQRLAFNAYITWALSEAFPEDARLLNSMEYLIAQLDAVDDNYTLALIANVLVNMGDPMAQEVINRLAGNVIREGSAAFVTSSTRDYFGAFGSIQYLQATALTSLALSNHETHGATNDLLINYVISQRDSWGTWHSTQATILSLKALTTHASQSPLEDGEITISIGDEQRVIGISSENTLDFYQVSFSNLERENIIDIEFPDLGKMTYKITQEFFAPYDSVVLDRGFEVSSRMNTDLAVHELVAQEIRIVNTSGDIVKNGLVAVSIPQGFRVERSSLALLRHMGIIERYEMRFENINLYLRDTEAGEVIDLTIAYRPAFPVVVTGGHVRVFDYYNPMVEGFLKPVEITVR